MVLLARHLLAQRTLLREWTRLEAHPLEFSEQHSTVRVRFLMDYFAADDRFRTEAGVSYQVTTDRHSLLFDLGFNRQGEDPSPLRRNLRVLGLESAPIDGVFISHNHRDHVGGLRNQTRKEPALEQLEPETLAHAVVWAPLPLYHPRCSCSLISHPMELRPGLASTGPLPAHLYFLGMLHEQSLLVSVRGRGVVLISGCGHPGITAMVRFAKKITEQQVLAVVGGLHLIATRGRNSTQKVLAANQPPWRLPNRRGVYKLAEELKSLGVRQVAPSAHDTCDEALHILQQVFGEGYTEVLAGGEVCFTAAG